MGSIDELTVSEQSETFENRDASAVKVIIRDKVIETEDSGDNSDEEPPPPFPFGYRGKTTAGTAGIKTTAVNLAKKKVDDKDEEPDDLDKRAMKEKEEEEKKKKK